MEGLTGQCLADFKEWHFKKIDTKEYKDKGYYYDFDYFDAEMLWGGFLAYADSKGYDVCVDKSLNEAFNFLSTFNYLVVNILTLDGSDSGGNTDTRQEAQQEAIKQFNILYNERCKS